MKIEKQDRFQDRYLPPFFRGDWEGLPIPQAEDIWRAVSKLPATQKTLKDYGKLDFIKPEAIDGRALLLEPFLKSLGRMCNKIGAKNTAMFQPSALLIDAAYPITEKV